MTARELEVSLIASSSDAIDSTTSNEEYDIPLDITDIINICREYNKLGWQIQNQVETILEVGVEESIKSGKVKRESLPHIKSFLKAICSNVYFGDAIAQAEECIYLIDVFYEKSEKSLSN